MFDGSSVWEGFECILRYLKDLKFGIIHIGGDPTEGKQREEEVREVTEKERSVKEQRRKDCERYWISKRTPLRYVLFF